MSEQMQTEESPQPAEGKSRPRRWPFGVLSLLLVVTVVGGVLLFNQRSDGPSTTVPTLPDPGGNSPTANPNLPGLPQDEPAPELRIELSDGSPFVLSQHLEEDGRPVFLNLWASWCIPCREEMPAIEAASRAHPEVLFLGVAVEDDPVAAEDFAQEIGVTYPIAVDDTERVARDFVYFGLPATFLISPDGTIIRSVFGGVDAPLIEALVLELLEL